MLKAHTLNIAENTARKRSIRKNELHMTNTSSRTDRGLPKKAAMHRKITLGTTTTTTSQRDRTVFKNSSNLHSI